MEKRKENKAKIEFKISQLRRKSFKLFKRTINYFSATTTVTYFAPPTLTVFLESATV